MRDGSRRRSWSAWRRPRPSRTNSSRTASQRRHSALPTAGSRPGSSTERSPGKAASIIISARSSARRSRGSSPPCGRRCGSDCTSSCSSSACPHTPRSTRASVSRRAPVGALRDWSMRCSVARPLLDGAAWRCPTRSVMRSDASRWSGPILAGWSSGGRRSSRRRSCPICSPPTTFPEGRRSERTRSARRATRSSRSSRRRGPPPDRASGRRRASSSSGTARGSASSPPGATDASPFRAKPPSW